MHHWWQLPTTLPSFWIVKLRSSRPIPPGSRFLSSSLNKQQVTILKTWEGNDGEFKGGQCAELHEALSPSYCFKMETKKTSKDTLEVAGRKSEEINGNPGACRYFYSNMWQKNITCGNFFLFLLGKIRVRFLHVATWIADECPSPVACNI